jgi:tripartite-type tricarboxylate transporter receptor subunit TctC
MRRFLCALAACVPAVASAQAWPSKPVRIIVPYAAGGATDTYARTFGAKLSEMWSQPVVVDNRPGAGGNIGAALVAKGPADGYSILLNTSGQAIAPALYRKLPYDTAKELQPVVMLVRSAQVLVTNPSLGAANVGEFVKMAKAQPGRINFGSTGIGSGPHLAGELFKSLAGVDIVHVPYKGDSALTPALLSNEVQSSFLPSQAAMPHVKSGKLKPLAVASGTRSQHLPDVPTIAESGVPGYELSTYAALFVVSGTPRDIVQKISADTARMLKTPEVLKILANWGVEPAAIGVDQFEPIFRSDLDKYAKLVRDARIPLVD